MGALFEFLAELITAFTVAALAQFGVLGDGSGSRAGEEPPSIQRTVLQNGRDAAPRTAATQDCEQETRLHSA